jgi:hypothetical protein
VIPRNATFEECRFDRIKIGNASLDAGTAQSLYVRRSFNRAAPGLSRLSSTSSALSTAPSTMRGSSGCAAADVGVMIRQLIDIPEVTASTTEHRIHKQRCACGVVTTAVVPAEATAPVVYGPNLRALAVYLLVFQHVPVEHTAMLLADVCGAAVSTGWVCRVLASTDDALADVDRLIKRCWSQRTCCMWMKPLSRSLADDTGCTWRAHPS